MKGERGAGSGPMGEGFLHLEVGSESASSVLAGAEEVGEDALGAGNQLWELAVESVGDVDIRSLAGMGDDEAATLGVLSGGGGLGEGGAGGVPGFEEGVPPLFDPGVEVGGGDGVGRSEQRICRFEELDGSSFVYDAFRAAEGKRNWGGEVAALVEDDQGSALLDELRHRCRQ